MLLRYKSGITIGTDPKPIRTGAAIHSLCVVTEGLFVAFKLHCRVYGGAADKDLNHKNDNTAITLKLKWANLYLQRDA